MFTVLEVAYTLGEQDESDLYSLSNSLNSGMFLSKTGVRKMCILYFDVCAVHHIAMC